MIRKYLAPELIKDLVQYEDGTIVNARFNPQTHCIENFSCV